MDFGKAARSLLPDSMAKAMERYSGAEEIRLRIGKEPCVVVNGSERAVSGEPVSKAVLLSVLERATGASLHAAGHALRGGYIVYHGIRIGVCGEAVYAGESLSGIRNFSSLAIRIPHECPAECGILIDKLLNSGPVSTLIAAPPGAGKTTFLRELIRRAAGMHYRVAVVDERNELSASFSGTAQFDLGYSSDILVGVSKERASMMLLRGMNPQIVAMDEITQEEDLPAVRQTAGCGVILFATAHGRDAEDMKRRPLYKDLLGCGIFQELVTIRNAGGRRIYRCERLTP